MLRKLLHEALGGLTLARGEEVERHDFAHALLETCELLPVLLGRLAALRQRRPQRPRLFADLLVLGITRGAEQVPHALVGQPFDERRLDDGAVAAAFDDLAQDPVEVLARVLAGWQRVDRILDRDRAEALEMA